MPRDEEHETYLQMVADAAEIKRLRASNAALLAALRAVVKMHALRGDPDGAILYRDHIGAIQQARAAIAQAEASPKAERTPGGDTCSICRGPIINGKWHEHACE